MANQVKEFVGTVPLPEVTQFDTNALGRWLGRHIEGYVGPMSVEKFKGGQSNPTYKLITPHKTYVMRSKPGPVVKLLPSAHAIEREYKVMSSLAATVVPVPNMYAICDDESVIGRAFYIMEFIAGRVLWDQSLPGMSKPERGAIYDEMNRVIAALHKVDFKAQGLENYGKPGNYLERQIHRWSKQYVASITQPIPEMDKLIDWLPAHMPQSTHTHLTSVVHGDFRLDNLVFHPTEPRILAVLDWELSTLGHPLADFSYHCMSWHIKPDGFTRGIGGLDLEGSGIPSEAKYIRRYCERTGFATPEQLAPDWDFYMAYNMFRIAAILQGIAKRVETGTASNEHARSAGVRARVMAELAWSFVQRA